jgi:ABC-type glycerol-3-phosphate transport system substrate-binding protein
MGINRREMGINRRELGLGALGLAGGALTGALGSPRRAAAEGNPSLTALWWDWKPWNETATEIFGRFEKQRGVSVQLNLTPFSDLNRAARAIPQQKVKPDLFLVDQFTHRALVALGVLRPLDDVFSAADLDDMLPVSRARHLEG